MKVHLHLCFHIFDGELLDTLGRDLWVRTFDDDPMGPIPPEELVRLVVTDLPVRRCYIDYGIEIVSQ